MKTTEEIYKATEVPKDATPEDKAKILAEGMYKRLKWYKEASEKLEAEKKAKEEAEKK